MYWFYNICLVAYWILQIPILIYRLVFEEGFYDRLKQSAGIMPTPTLQRIAYLGACRIRRRSGRSQPDRPGTEEEISR